MSNSTTFFPLASGGGSMFKRPVWDLSIATTAMRVKSLHAEFLSPATYPASIYYGTGVAVNGSNMVFPNGANISVHTGVGSTSLAALSSADGGKNLTARTLAFAGASTLAQHSAIWTGFRYIVMASHQSGSQFYANFSASTDMATWAAANTSTTTNVIPVGSVRLGYHALTDGAGLVAAFSHATTVTNQYMTFVDSGSGNVTVTFRTLPVSMSVRGTINISGTYYLIGTDAMLNPSIGYLYSSTDLINWTARTVRLTSGGTIVSGSTGTTNTLGPFLPLGIASTGSAVVIAAISSALDMQVSGINTLVATKGIEFYSSANPATTDFLPCGTWSPTNETGMGSNNNLMSSPLVISHLNEAGSFPTWTANALASNGGMLAMSMILRTYTYDGGVPVVLPTIPTMITSRDGGQTWELRMNVNGNASGSPDFMGPIIAHPDGGFAMLLGAATYPFPFVRSNILAKELAIPYT